nr:hypothetical protein [Tanacetum cinerariifolium]
MPSADSYSVVAVATLNIRRTPIQKQPEALLCLVGLRRNYFLGDDVYLTFLYDDDWGGILGDTCRPRESSLDFADEDPPLVITERRDKVTAEVIPELSLGKEVTAMGLVVNKRRRIEADSTIFVPATQKTPVNAKSVSDPNPLSYAEPRPILKQDIAQSSKKTPVAEDPDSEKSTSFTSIVGSPGSIYRSGWGVTNNCRLDTLALCQDVVDHIVPPGYFLELRDLPNDDFLSQYNIKLARQVAMGSQLREKHIKNLEALLESEADMKGAVKAKNVELVKELENLHAQITGEERIKAAFEEFKKYEDDRVNSRCAKIDVRLDALSIDFDEEMYPHMLTAIVFVDVVSAGIAKGMSEGIKHGVEHGKEKVDLAAIKLEKLKDAPIDVIMASLFLESDSGKDAPHWIRELRPSSSQLKISVYHEKKKCRMVCRTHEVGFAHHTKSDGIPLSVPIIAPQGLAILLADVVTQTEIIEDKASSRLLRSKSLPSMYNLDWP